MTKPPLDDSYVGSDDDDGYDAADGIFDKVAFSANDIETMVTRVSESKKPTTDETDLES